MNKILIEIKSKLIKQISNYINTFNKYEKIQKQEINKLIKISKPLKNFAAKNKHLGISKIINYSIKDCTYEIIRHYDKKYDEELCLFYSKIESIKYLNILKKTKDENIIRAFVSLNNANCLPKLRNRYATNNNYGAAWKFLPIPKYKLINNSDSILFFTYLHNIPIRYYHSSDLYDILTDKNAKTIFKLLPLHKQKQLILKLKLVSNIKQCIKLLSFNKELQNILIKCQIFQ